MDVVMTLYTQSYNLVHSKDIVHGDLTGVGFISKWYLAEFNEFFADQCFGWWLWKSSSRRLRSIDGCSWGRKFNIRLIAGGKHTMDAPRVCNLHWRPRWAPNTNETNQNRRCLLVWLYNVTGALDTTLDNFVFLSRSKILSGEEPYSWIGIAVQVISAIVVGRAPFRKVTINMDESHRLLSSRCLSKCPEGRPSIVEITTIIVPSK